MSQNFWVGMRNVACRGIGRFLFLAGVMLLGSHVKAQSTSTLTASSASQSAVSPSGSAYAQLFAAFLSQQQALSASFLQATAQGATPSNVSAWQQQNAAALAAQQSRAAQLADFNSLRLRPILPAPSFPPNVPQAISEYVTAGVALANARAQIHNQMVAALPASPTSAQIAQMTSQEVQLFEDQHGNDLDAQDQRIQGLGIDNPPHLPLTVAVQLPAGMDPNVAAFLTFKTQIMNDLLKVLNRNATADAATRMAAIQQWQVQNSSRLASLQTFAENLGSQTP